ncbi:hypothetical protein D9757_006413 [Collybiopsis confluens]|uniref:BTB domain-containing protein n=1 Tax=Collybiopsis confluens TaxID=2823264 RepID=A0A8H5M8G8_9AGAR|nr:hypothetical protein D9757_006413 [Collybiopsis confluens]
MMILEPKPETAHSTSSHSNTVIEEAEQDDWIQANGTTKPVSSPLSDYDGVLLNSPSSVRSHFSVRPASPAPAPDSKQWPQPIVAAAVERSSTIYHPLSNPTHGADSIFDERHILSSINRKHSVSTLHISPELAPIPLRPVAAPAPEIALLSPHFMSPTPMPADTSRATTLSCLSTPQSSAPPTPLAPVDSRTESPVSRLSTPQSLLTADDGPTPILLSPAMSVPSEVNLVSPRFLPSSSSSPVSLTPVIAHYPHYPVSSFGPPSPVSVNPFSAYVPPLNLSPLPGSQRRRRRHFPPGRRWEEDSTDSRPPRRHWGEESMESLPPRRNWGEDSIDFLPSRQDWGEESTDSFPTLQPPYTAYIPPPPPLPPKVRPPRSAPQPPFIYPPTPRLNRYISTPWAAPYPLNPTPPPANLNVPFHRMPTPPPPPPTFGTWAHYPDSIPVQAQVPPAVWNSPFRPFIPPVIPRTPGGESIASLPPLPEFLQGVQSKVAFDQPSSGLPSQAKRHERFFFDDGRFTIQVKDTLYKIHEHFIQLHAPSLWSPVASRPRVTHLYDVEPHQFDLVLSLLYPKNLLEHEPKTTSDWSSVLHVAHALTMSQIRALALSHLATLASPADKIELANKYNVREWLFDSYMELSLRMQGLSVEEASKVGVEGTLLITDMKEKVAKGIRKFVDGPPATGMFLSPSSWARH